MNVVRKPNVAFGRRGNAGPPPAASGMSAAGPATPPRPVGALAASFGLVALAAAAVGAILLLLPGVARINGDYARATARVIAIVNQPVTHLPRSGPVGIFAPGWFHPGAIKPDFDTVDVRDTQQLLYSGYGHVTSDINPTEMFIGSELEFNAMTKYFYTDRSVPKHRLSDSEMVEINGLYRTIGRDQRALWQELLAIAGLAVAACGFGFAFTRVAGRAFGGGGATAPG